MVTTAFSTEPVNASIIVSTFDETVLNFILDNGLDADLCGWCLTKEVVDTLHAKGRKVNVWTLDTLEHAEMARAAGVDFITTNILE